MALSFKLPAPHDRFYEPNPRDANETRMRPDVENAILWTMPCGIGVLKDEATAIEFWARASFLSRLHEWGPEEEAFPLQTALDLVGLRCNVTYEPEAAWLRRVSKFSLGAIRTTAKRKTEKAKEAAK